MVVELVVPVVGPGVVVAAVLGASSGAQHLVSTDNPTLAFPSFFSQWRVPILHSSLTKVVMFCPIRNVLSSKVQHLKYDILFIILQSSPKEY